LKTVDGKIFSRKIKAKKISLYENLLFPTSHNLSKEQYYLSYNLTTADNHHTSPPIPNMKFLTLTRIAALLATSGLAFASIDVCAGGVKLECDRKAKGLLDNLDSMPPLTAFRSVRMFLEKGCDGACLSSELKADLCEKAHSIKSLIPQRIYLEDIEQCFGALNGEQDSCHVSYECPPGTPEGNKCITNSCIKNAAEAAAQAGPRAMSATKGDNCYISYQCPSGTPDGYVCLTEICDSEKPASRSRSAKKENCHWSYQCPPGTPPDKFCLTEICETSPKQCLGSGAYVGPFSTDNLLACEEKCCSGSCYVGYNCPPGTPEGFMCLSANCDRSKNDISSLSLYQGY
jgi:hypothetical protein